MRTNTLINHEDRKLFQSYNNFKNLLRASENAGFTHCGLGVFPVKNLPQKEQVLAICM